MKTLLERAVRIAVKAHKDQTRKGDGLPYITHPFMVALRLAKLNFPDEVIAAALVHDVLEDTNYGEENLRAELGNEVVNMVLSVTNDESLEWMDKKKKYVETVRSGNEGAKAVALSDKIHNLESLLIAHSEKGSKVWENFKADKSQKLWFEIEVLKMLRETWDHPMLDEYEQLIEKEKQLD